MFIHAECLVLSFSYDIITIISQKSFTITATYINLTQPPVTNKYPMLTIATCVSLSKFISIDFVLL